MCPCRSGYSGKTTIQRERENLLEISGMERKNSTTSRMIRLKKATLLNENRKFWAD
jgi:hypothetical protein